MQRDAYLGTIRNHYQGRWKSGSEVLPGVGGPKRQLPDGFSVLRFAPRPGRGMWTYATCGMSAEGEADALEVHLFSAKQDDRLAEVLSLVASFHRGTERLGREHVVPLPRPWQDGSTCDQLLFSLPHLDGPQLEWLTLGPLRIRFLWLIPITVSEREFKRRYGTGALEQLFDSEGLNYLDPGRAAVV